VVSFFVDDIELGRWHWVRKGWF